MLCKTIGYFRRNVIGFLALFVALGGTAYAVNTVGSADIIDGQVKSVDIGDNEIGSSDVKDNSLNTFDVHSFLGVDVVDGSLTGADISDNTIGVNDIGSQQVGSDEVANDSLLQSDIRAVPFDPDAPSFVYTIDARSGASGEDPRGTIYWHYQRGSQGEVNATVSCLAVDGNTAVIGFSGIFGGVFNGKNSIAGRVRITEREAADDTFEYAFNEIGPGVDYFDPDPPPIPGPTDCSTFPGPLPPERVPDVRNINDGGAAVTDENP